MIGRHEGQGLARPGVCHAAARGPLLGIGTHRVGKDLLSALDHGGLEGSRAAQLRDASLGHAQLARGLAEREVLLGHWPSVRPCVNH